MNHFEGVIKTILEHDGYWVRQSFKVELTKQEKRDIGKPSLPRPEIDLLAFKQSENKILALEAKSYLDSSGIHFNELQKRYDTPEGRYKLFTCCKYQRILLDRLMDNLINIGMADMNTHIILGLVAGKVHKSMCDEVQEYFNKNNWFFWGPDDVKNKLNELAQSRYENDPAIITTKILMR